MAGKDSKTRSEQAKRTEVRGSLKYIGSRNKLVVFEIDFEEIGGLLKASREISKVVIGKIENREHSLLRRKELLGKRF